jgi:hypothetical protein
MDKRLIYPQYNAEGERDVFSVTEDRRWLRKTAGAYHPEIQSYIEKAKPLDGLIQVLLTALGAHEYWGQNVNGDRFYEASLKNDGTDYGYKTFLSNANYFTHHVNRDPALAKGKVLATVWNDKAKRVELVVGINPELDTEAASMLDNGEPLCFSMGARLPYDMCTVCSNKARTRAEYCDHLRYQMNQIDPTTGILVGANNPFPKFFDISRVLIPADKTAYMWEKIAHASNNPLAKVGSAQLAEESVRQHLQGRDLQKTASVTKAAELRKRIVAVSHPGAVERLKTALLQVKHALDKTAVEIPEEVFREGPNYSQCINSMAALGITPLANEAKALERIFAKEGGVLPPVEVSVADVSPRLLKKLAAYAQDRSCYRPLLVERVRAAAQEKWAAVDPVAAAAAAKGSAGVGAAIAKGVMSALGGLFGVSGEMGPKADKVVKDMPAGLSGMISKHPVLAGVLGLMILKQFTKSKNPPEPVVAGNFTVADDTQGFYNNDWQRRFYQMQNRPVAVIKTGAAQGKLELVPSPEASLLVSPLSYLLMTVDLEKTAEMQRSWEMIADQVVTSIQSEPTKEIVKSASRIAGNDLQNMSFSVPELGDLEIIKHVLTVTKA